jgi:glycosyltransferase involved in cell wall biosynthesis
MPRTVFAAPLFNHARHAEAALRSILAQTDEDLALLLIDDGSTDGTEEVARRLAAEDPRVRLEVNPRRLGMLHNTRRAWRRAHVLYPDARYWALASDHDLWDSRWLAKMRATLDADPAVALAYPLTRRIDDEAAPRRGIASGAVRRATSPTRACGCGPPTAAWWRATWSTASSACRRSSRCRSTGRCSCPTG